jgi:AcrR family transcriptional regulator
MADAGPPPRSRRAAQGARTRDQILDVALACVDEGGLAYASSNEIARRAGITWGAIQHHFGTRNELFLALIERNFRQLQVDLASADVERSGPLDRLQAVADLVWAYCRDPRYRVSWEIILDFRRDPAALARYEERMRTLEDALVDAWDRLLGTGTGDGHHGPPDRTYARILFGAMRGFALNLHTHPAAGEYTQERAALVRMLRNELRS